MHEVSTGLFLGNRHDSRKIPFNSKPWAVVHASHEAHRERLGYRKGAPRNSEYYTARRGQHLYVNIITKDLPTGYHQALFTDSLAFIKEHREQDYSVLICSDKGGNRPSGIALVYLAQERLIPHESFDEALAELRQHYPLCTLRSGLAAYLRHNWEYFIQR